METKRWQRRLLAFVLSLSPTFSLAAPRSFVLDAISTSGSERLPPHFFEEELGLHPQSSLSPQDLERLQTQLLGTGLFRSVRLYLEKGEQPGHARLLVELDDDLSVLGPWGLGAELAISEAQLSSRSLSPNLSPLGVKSQLISRNLFGHLHRGSALLDIDGDAKVRGAQLAYGFPRFSAEDTQFDAQIEIIDPSTRYLEAGAFGAKAQALWTLGSEGLRHVQVGVAYASNQNKNFQYRDFPKSVIGPQLGMSVETRLLGFRPSQDYHLGGTLLLTSAGLRQMAYAAEGAYTWELSPHTSLTAESQMESVGLLSFHMRNGLHFDFTLPIWQSEQDPSFFLQALQGLDRFENQHLDGHEWRLGLRLHSAGLIAEISFAYRDLPAWPDGTPLARRSP